MRQLKKNLKEIFRVYIIGELGTLLIEYTKYKEIFKEEIKKEVLPKY
jgi:uncharacterized membrane protein